jgi:hypothetical protein
MTYISPYMTEVYLRQQRHQIAADAERHRITHDSPGRENRHPMHRSPPGMAAASPMATTGSTPVMSMTTRSPNPDIPDGLTKASRPRAGVLPIPYQSATRLRQALPVSQTAQPTTRTAGPQPRRRETK